MYVYKCNINLKIQFNKSKNVNDWINITMLASSATSENSNCKYNTG